MPLAALQIKQHKRTVVYLVAKNTNPTLARSMLERFRSEDSEGKENYMTKTCVKELLKAAESDVERERITFALSQASGHSNKKIKELYGFQERSKRKEPVENVLAKAKEIREAMENIACIQEKALLKSFGIEVQIDCFVHGETTSSSINNDTGTSSICDDPDQVMDILQSCCFNWFEFVDIIRENMENQPKECVDQVLKKCSAQIHLIKLNGHEKCLIEQSRHAFNAMEKEEGSISDVEEENIQSEIEEDYVDWGAIHDPLQDEGKEMIEKKVQSYHLKSKRKAARKIAEARFLQRKRGKSVGKILRKCADIGKTIESYVRGAGVGADSCRRTGLLTFDGNRKIKKKATFAGIKEHLKKIWIWICSTTLCSPK